MFVSVIVTNYNYAEYLEDAVRSAVEQNRGLVEIIVVDDGSADGSKAIIEKLSYQFTNIIPIFKPNGGQLSAFNAGVQMARGDVLFFLDADDLYRENYIEKALEVYKQHPSCDFLFCGYDLFGNVNDQDIANYPDRITDIGLTGLITYCTRVWIGGPTSTISLKRSLAEQFFPIPYEADWRVRADDCLVWLASLYNGRKFYLKDALVAYRTHGNNSYFGSLETNIVHYLHTHRCAKLFAYAAEQLKQYHYLHGYELFSMLLREAQIGRKEELVGVYRNAFMHDYSIPYFMRRSYCRKLKRLFEKQRS